MAFTCISAPNGNRIYQVKAIKNNENSRSSEFGGESDPDHLFDLQSRA
ncbi:hypothetical protein SAMN05428949_5078 [Chitinophaga sp. YR627]|nr:hypothetical protein SAMN05428949_5078 [Chitinophaga sp. YR627]